MEGSVEDIIERSEPAEKVMASAQQLRKAYEKACKETRQEYKLTQNEWEVMRFLWKNPEFNSARDIADSQSVSRSLVCKSVEALEKRRLLAVQPDAEDRRYVRLYLTEEARDILRQSFFQETEFLKMVFQNVSSEEQDLFFCVLGKIRENVKRVMETESAP